MKGYLKKSFGTGILNVVGSAVISVVFLPLILRKLGLEFYGLWSMLFLFTGLSGVADFGLSKSLVFLLPKEKHQKAIDEIFSAGLLVNMLVVLSVCCICGVLYLFKVNVWHTKQAFDQTQGIALFISGAFLLCVSLITNFFRSVLEANYKIYLVNIGFLLITALNYSSIYFLSFFTRDIYNYIYCSLSIYVVILAFHISATLWTCRVALTMPRKETFRTIGSVSIKFFSVDMLVASVMPLNRYLLIIFSGSTMVYGMFDVAMKISLMANSFLSLFGTPMLSLFSGYGNTRFREIRDLLRKTTLALICSYLFGCLLFYVMGKEILRVWFGIRSTDVYWIAFILLAGICLNGVAEPAYRAFLALGRLRFALKIKTMTILINLLLVIILFRLPPLYRIAFAISFSYAVTSCAIVIASVLKLTIPSARPVPQV